MPCYDDRTSPKNVEAATRAELQPILDRQQEQIDNLTEMLCWACGFLEHLGKFPVEGCPPLNGWWEKHKAVDKKRSNVNSFPRRYR